MKGKSASSRAGDDRDGEVLADRYRIDTVIGRGGMSSVYRAFDTSLGRTVTLKVFLPELAAAEDIARQREEIRMLASLNHPSLVTLFDAVAGDDGRAFLVLEYVDGSDLRAVLSRSRLDSAAIAGIGIDVAAALAYIHALGVVHRDVKPGNILVPTPGTSAHVNAKLADFGIARLVDATRLTMTGSVLGTASYLSPEQSQGAAVGPASDIYSLGLVLLECATGEKAFDGTGLEAAVARLSRDPRVPSVLRPEWASLFVSMTQRQPADRPTADDVGAMLRELADTPLEDLAPTLRLPAASVETVATALMDVGPADVETVAMAAPPRATEPDPTVRLTGAHAPSELTPEPRRMNRRAVAIGLSAAAVILVTVVAVAIGANSGSPGPATDGAVAPEYPTVQGTLGEHLAQLQESVAP